MLKYLFDFQFPFLTASGASQLDSSICLCCVTEQEDVDAFPENRSISFCLLPDQWDSLKFESGFLNFRGFDAC